MVHRINANKYRWPSTHSELCTVQDQHVQQVQLTRPLVESFVLHVAQCAVSPVVVVVVRWQSANGESQFSAWWMNTLVLMPPRRPLSCTSTNISDVLLCYCATLVLQWVSQFLSWLIWVVIVICWCTEFITGIFCSNEFHGWGGLHLYFWGRKLALP